MKTKNLILLSIPLVANIANGQGTFVYDQQSATEGAPVDGGAALSQQPLGQSFTPTLPNVGFVRFYVYDGFLGFNTGDMIVNLRADSITGTVLATTTPVTLGDGTSGYVDFFFDGSAPVTPGATYYFQPIMQSGSGFGLNASPFYNYAGGTAYTQGAVWPNFDLWFREGVVVPEPSLMTLFLLGGAGLAAARSRHRRQ